MLIYYVTMMFDFFDNLKAVLSLPHREESIDTTLTFSNAVFRFADTANNAYNGKFRVRGRVTSKTLRGTTLICRGSANSAKFCKCNINSNLTQIILRRTLQEGLLAQRGPSNDLRDQC